MATNQLFDLSAAADFSTANPSLEALLREMSRASPIALPDPVPSAEKSENDEMPQPPATPNEPSTSEPTEKPNPVCVCCEAYNEIINQLPTRNSSDYDRKRDAEIAYLNKIPRLDDPENIQDFVACVAYAMLLKIIQPADGTRILYAAQVATQVNQANRANNKIANRNKTTSKIPE